MKNKVVTKVMSYVLTAAMVVALIPMTAYAGTGSAMQMGIGGIDSGDTVYFGTYNNTTDVPWTVLGSGILSETTHQDNVLPMLSTYYIGESVFINETEGYYPDSTLKTEMNTTLYGSMFSSEEQGAIAETTLLKNSMHSTISENLIEQTLFPLSLSEYNALGSSLKLAKSISNPDGSDWEWWLRSSDSGMQAISVTGIYCCSSVEASFGVRPAFHLNRSLVVFSSAAVDGKPTSTNGTMSAISSTAPTAWKLTLDDSTARSGFSVTETTMTANQGDTKTITYSNAQPGSNEYVSAIITNTAGTEILYYGKLANNSASGTANVTIPSSLGAGEYKLKVFNEQCNGDKKTDLSSAFKNISLTVTGTPTPTPQPNSGNSEDSEKSSETQQNNTKKSEDTYVNPLTWSYAEGSSNIQCVIEKQGPACVAMFKAATPVDYTEAFSFNLLLKKNGTFQQTYDRKFGKFTLNIPKEYQKSGRTFVLIGIDQFGKVKYFTDEDFSDGTFTTTLDIEGYAFSLICTDTGAPLLTGNTTTGSGTYTVQKGDTLSGIAKKLGKTKQSLINKNQLKNPNKLRINQKIVY